MNKLRQLSPLLAILTGAVAFHFFASQAANFDPEIEGFGKNWKGVSNVRFNDQWILGLKPVIETIKDKKSKQEPVVLLLGASQLHTISNFIENDQVAVSFFNESLRKAGDERLVVQISYGNANTHEMMSLLLKLKAADALPDAVIMAFTYDDFREPGIRDELLTKVTPEVSEICGDAISQVVALEQKSEAKAVNAPIKRTTSEKTPQETTEKHLVTGLERIWPTYAARGKLQGRMELASKEFLTSMILGKSRRSSVVVPDEKTNENVDSFNAMIKFLKHEQIGFRLYRAPLLKQDDYSYYVQSEYDKAWNELADTAAQEGFATLDLDGLVPAQRFGKTNSGLADFFHFDSAGHQLLGDELANWLSGEKPDGI